MAIDGGSVSTSPLEPSTVNHSLEKIVVRMVEDDSPAADVLVASPQRSLVEDGTTETDTGRSDPLEMPNDSGICAEETEIDAISNVVSETVAFASEEHEHEQVSTDTHQGELAKKEPAVQCNSHPSKHLIETISEFPLETSSDSSDDDSIHLPAAFPLSSAHTDAGTNQPAGQVSNELWKNNEVWRSGTPQRSVQGSTKFVHLDDKAPSITILAEQLSAARNVVQQSEITKKLQTHKVEQLESDLSKAHDELRLLRDRRLAVNVDDSQMHGSTASSGSDVEQMKGQIKQLQAENEVLAAERSVLRRDVQASTVGHARIHVEDLEKRLEESTVLNATLAAATQAAQSKLQENHAEQGSGVIPARDVDEQTRLELVSTKLLERLATSESARGQAQRECEWAKHAQMRAEAALKKRPTCQAGGATWNLEEACRQIDKLTAMVHDLEKTKSDHEVAVENATKNLHDREETYNLSLSTLRNQLESAATLHSTWATQQLALHHQNTVNAQRFGMETTQLRQAVVDGQRALEVQISTCSNLQSRLHEREREKAELQKRLEATDMYLASTLGDTCLGASSLDDTAASGTLASPQGRKKRNSKLGSTPELLGHEGRNVSAADQVDQDAAGIDVVKLQAELKAEKQARESAVKRIQEESMMRDTLTQQLLDMSQQVVQVEREHRHSVDALNRVRNQYVRLQGLLKAWKKDLSPQDQDLLDFSIMEGAGSYVAPPTHPSVIVESAPHNASGHAQASSGKAPVLPGEKKNPISVTTGEGTTVRAMVQAVESTVSRSPDGRPLANASHPLSKAYKSSVGDNLVESNAPRTVHGEELKHDSDEARMDAPDRKSERKAKGQQSVWDATIGESHSSYDVPGSDEDVEGGGLAKGAASDNSLISQLSQLHKDLNDPDSREAVAKIIREAQAANSKSKPGSQHPSGEQGASVKQIIQTGQPGWRGGTTDKSAAGTEDLEKVHAEFSARPESEQTETSPQTGHVQSPASRVSVNPAVRHWTSLRRTLTRSLSPSKRQTRESFQGPGVPSERPSHDVSDLFGSPGTDITKSVAGYDVFCLMENSLTPAQSQHPASGPVRSSQSSPKQGLITQSQSQPLKMSSFRMQQQEEQQRNLITLDDPPRQSQQFLLKAPPSGAAPEKYPRPVLPNPRPSVNAAPPSQSQAIIPFVYNWPSPIQTARATMPEYDGGRGLTVTSHPPLTHSQSSTPEGNLVTQSHPLYIDTPWQQSHTAGAAPHSDMLTGDLFPAQPHILNQVPEEAVTGHANRAPEFGDGSLVVRDSVAEEARRVEKKASPRWGIMKMFTRMTSRTSHGKDQDLGRSSFGYGRGDGAEASGHKRPTQDEQSSHVSAYPYRRRTVPAQWVPPAPVGRLARYTLEDGKIPSPKMLTLQGQMQRLDKIDTNNMTPQEALERLDNFTRIRRAQVERGDQASKSRLSSFV